MLVYKLRLVVTFFIAVTSYGNLLNLRGGAAKPRNDDGEMEYYDQFELDYGKVDNVRIAGAMRGFLETGKLKSLEEKDSFLKWIYSYLEDGPEPLESRTKPFYALDIGSRKDLKPGESPKLMIVNRKLAKNEQGELSAPNEEIDIEERVLWQPWLRSRCDFVVRYIVPNRINIIRIMEAKNRFNSQLVVQENDSEESNSRRAWVKMTFRPRLIGRLFGKRDVEIRRELPAEELFGPSVKKSKGKKVIGNFFRDAFKTFGIKT